MPTTKGKGRALDSDSDDDLSEPETDLDDHDDMSADDVEPAVREIVKKGALICNPSGNNQWGGRVGKYSGYRSFSISYLTNVVNLL